MEPIHIAVCEDRTEEPKKLLAILDYSEIPTETATFANGEDFLKEYRPNKYNLLLMDIYMGGKGDGQTENSFLEVDALRRC